ncbi:MAG: NAD-dependent epimerase/dehydratase family protein [Acidimicrobiia bacterium]
MRVLVTGLGSVWGSRVALALEQEPSVELVVGVDTDEPELALATTEFVRVDPTYSLLQRIVAAARVDTILHLHTITDSSQVGRRALHETNVIGTANLLAAAAAGEVRKLIVKSSTHVYGSTFEDPYWFREDTPRKRPPSDRLERSLVEADDMVSELVEDDRRVMVTRLRFADVLGADVESAFSRVLQLPVVPEVLGFDPRLQFLHEHDAVAAVVFATVNQVPGVFNVAGDGIMPWSEVCAVSGKRRVPLPPLLTAWAVEPLRRLRLAPIPSEMLRVLRYGRAVDTSRYQRAGFRFTHTTASAVDDFAQWLRLHLTVGDAPEYRYEREPETFLWRAPAVVRD